MTRWCSPRGPVSAGSVLAKRETVRVPLAEKVDYRDFVPAIMQTMSHRPDFFKAMMDVSRVHFSDGALTRAQHEMIASYVSALNKCHY